MGGKAQVPLGLDFDESLTSLDAGKTSDDPFTGSGSQSPLSPWMTRRAIWFGFDFPEQDTWLWWIRIVIRLLYSRNILYMCVSQSFVKVFGVEWVIVRIGLTLVPSTWDIVLQLWPFMCVDLCTHLHWYGFSSANRFVRWHMEPAVSKEIIIIMNIGS